MSYYELDILPIILARFKVKNIVISGFSDKEIINQIYKYCNKSNASYVGIDSEYFEEKIISNFTLNVLPDLFDYDAIFLNDDPNWYTVYNELKLIKENNKEFPLVFICHNVFPHKRRDSYINPDVIPNEFRKEYSKEFNYDGNLLNDNFYHALQENTPKNGVLTAIEDFLSENKSIKIMNLNLINGITILYPNNSISQIRLSVLTDEIKKFAQEYEDFSDNIFENKLLINNLSKLNLSNEKLDYLKTKIDEKDKIISNYENKIKLHDDELKYKESEIEGFESKLALKDAKIIDIESKLINRENEIDSLFTQNNLLKEKINQQESDLKNNELEFNNQTEESENIFKRRYLKQLSELDNKEYCISCYKEELNNNDSEIKYLKKFAITRKLLSPLSYIIIIIKSSPKEISLNFKLYKALKNSKCFDIGYYLFNNKDIQESKWCKFFSPELHYICYGFNEKREFNKKFFNTNSKKELLNYIYKCK